MGPPPPGFVAAERSEVWWERTYTAEEWVDLLGTHSDHRLLEPARRHELHGAVRAVIESHGGSFVLPYRVELLRLHRS